MEADRRPRRGIIFILSGPSGAGKTTISRPALKAIEGLETSISLTTRAPREGEIGGFDYQFVSDEEFKSRVERSELAEWVRNFDASYGTPREPLDRAVAAGRDILLDIDIEGARKIRKAYPEDAVAIFVLPPSFAELEERLRRRGTENEAAIGERLRRAVEETSAYPEYDYLIINANSGDSLSRLRAVVEAERLKVGRLREEFAQWKISAVPEPSQLDELIDSVKAYNAQADAALIRRAYEYSARMHAEQKRMSGEPYVTHPLAVARIIAGFKQDQASIVTGLLHDVVEDTSTSLEEVQNLFGAEVARLVDGVTKVSKITFSSREEKQAENFRKMIIAMAHDIRVVLIKLADRLHNMRTLDHMSPDKQEEISRETLEIYAPIAHRLGMYWLKSELEDAAMRYLNPSVYSTLKAYVAKTRKEREEYIRFVIEIISRRLGEAGVKAEVTGRPKHFYSIHNKMQEEGLNFDEVHDLIAFRIIVANVRECYDALGVVHANWKPIPGRFKDYIALPKVNMYQSLHTTVIGPRAQRMEVQIRTREMHEVAEQGIAAHWTYKEGASAQMRDTERFAWLRRLIEWQQNLKDPQEFLSTIKDDLFPEEVFVFTPKGDLLDFPQSATIIDFAYRIHSQVGHHLSGARVNGRMVPLRYRLKSGDTVEVITSERQTPGKDWANFVVTARAKSRIRQWLRQQQAERSRELGVSLLDTELEPLGLSVAKLKGRLDPALKEFSQRDVDSLLAAVGYGIVTPGQFLTKVLTPEELKQYRGEKPPVLPSADRERPAQDDGKSSDNAVIVSGVGDMLVRFAHCCNPLPGEVITGFITRGRGVTVHLAGCPHALATDPQRRVPVVWKVGEESLRPIRLEVLCIDQPGLLAAMSKAIAAAGVNISTAEVKTTGQDGRALSLFELKVTSAAQLTNLMHSIAAIDGVMRVSRLGLQGNSNHYRA